MPNTLTVGTMEMRVPEVPLFIPERAMQVIKQIQTEHMNLALMTIAGYVSQTAPRNFGHLAQSFTANPATATGGIEILSGGQAGGTELMGRVFSSLPHAIVMEEGRRPGQRMPPIEAIRLWVIRKMHVSDSWDDDELEQISWAVAISIARKGIAGLHYAKAGFEKAKPKVERLFAEMGKAIAEGLTGGRQ